MSILNEISEKLQDGEAEDVKALVQQAIDEGIPAKDILEQGLLNGMSVIGGKFSNNEVYVPEVLVAARAMNMGAQVLKPLLAESGIKAAGKVVLGTVKGDLHDIGKNLVRMMMEGRGLEVIDIGMDVEPARYIEVAQAEGCKVIACSALLTTTMGVMREVVEAAKTAGIRDQVKIMIGGAPVTQAFCDMIGADIYTEDAAVAAEKAVACFNN
jgi:corrinoid protein of di/trimethylamine methyltransferase